MKLYENYRDKSCEIIDLKPPTVINLPNFNISKVNNQPFEWHGYDCCTTLILKICSKFYFQEFSKGLAFLYQKSFANNLTTESEWHHRIT